LRKRGKDGAKMELRKNRTINTPKLVYLHKWGDFRFSFIKPRRKHLS